MLKPHPRGPRIYRNLIEATFSLIQDPESTTLSSFLGTAPTLLESPSPSLDLTRFAGRLPTSGEAFNTGFELPPSVSLRLKLVHPAELAEIDHQQRAIDA